MIRKGVTIASGTVVVAIFVVALGQFVLYSRAESGLAVPASSADDVAAFTSAIDTSSLSPAVPLAPPTAVLPTGIQRHVVRPGDTLSELAATFGMDVKELKKINGLRDPDRISVGQELFYYPPKPAPTEAPL